MLDRIARTRRISAAAIAALAALLPAAAPASAARAPTAKAAIVACGGDSAIVAADLRGGSRARGAELVARIELVPLVGDARVQELRLGRRSSARTSARFDGLPAGAWWGYVTYRWTRGRRTVARGVERTDATRVGRRRGRAVCTLARGLGRRDETPPEVFVEPTDSDWRRGPLEVRFHAFDDFSGVRQVNYRVDGGEQRSGRSFTLDAQGTYEVEYSAEDAAGNRSQAKRATIRVDTAPPTVPAVSWPPSVTSDSTPRIAWSAASDSGSGVAGYAVVVRDSAGSIVGFEQVGAGATEAALSTGLSDGSYQAQVYAVDATRPEPWVAASEPRSFRVDSSAPRLVSSDPAHGAIVSAASAGANLRLAFDRPLAADSIRAGDTVSLARVSPGADPPYAATCASPCDAVVVDPDAALPEGIYELSWTSGLRAEDGTPVGAGSVRFAVPFFERDFDAGGCTGFVTQPPWGCGSGAFPGTQLRAAPSSRDTLDVAGNAESPGADLAFAGEAVVGRVTRQFVRGAAACDDRGRLELREGAGTALASVEHTSSTGPGEVLLETAPLSGTRSAVRFHARFEQEGSVTCGNGSSPSAFYVDSVQLSRKP